MARRRRQPIFELTRLVMVFVVGTFFIWLLLTINKTSIREAEKIRRTYSNPSISSGKPHAAKNTDSANVAQVYKCINLDGSVTFSDRVCRANEIQEQFQYANPKLLSVPQHSRLLDNTEK
jgi:hypothetical protein